MKKIISGIAIFLLLFSSCQKTKCKERQAVDLQRELKQFQTEVSNTNLTAAQRNEAKQRHDARNAKILAECKVYEPNGAGGGYHISIDKYHQGVIRKLQGEWIGHLNDRSELTSDDIMIIGEMIDKATL